MSSITWHFPTAGQWRAKSADGYYAISSEAHAT